MPRSVPSCWARGSTTERAAGALAALGVAFGAGCQPDFGVRASSVEALRVLAVSADPKKSGKLALCLAKNSGPQSI